jgi:hypothetical protein
VTRFYVGATDVDNEAVALSAAALPAGASFNPGTGEFRFSPSAACDLPDAVYEVTFTAADARGASSSAPVRITVVDHAGSELAEPVVSVPARTIVVAAGKTSRFSVVAMPSGDCAATVVASGNRGTFDPEIREFEFTPASSARGNVLVPFLATGCNGMTETRTVRIDVIPASETHRGRVAVAVERLEIARAMAGSENGYVIVPIVNEGDAALTVKRITTRSSSSLRLDGILGLPVVLQPGQELPVRVALQSRTAGDIEELLTIETSDGDRTVVIAGHAAN